MGNLSKFEQFYSYTKKLLDYDVVDINSFDKSYRNCHHHVIVKRAVLLEEMEEILYPYLSPEGWSKLTTEAQMNIYNQLTVLVELLAEYLQYSEGMTLRSLLYGLDPRREDNE